jgi:hypothetical protein
VSRLYQYADSNSKTGLFLLDGYKGRNTTFQVSSTGEELFRHLDYEPGIRNHERGPRIPDELHWGLFEVGWVYTNESDVTPPTNDAGDIIIEDEEVELTPEMAAELVSFLQNVDEEADKTEELSEILDLSSAASAPFIWNVSQSRCQDIAEKVGESVTAALNQSSSGKWTAKGVLGTKSEFDDESGEKAVIEARLINQSDPIGRYHNIAYFCPEHGFETIATVTDRQLDWDNRIALEQQRQHLLESIISVARSEAVDIGDPGADVRLVSDSDAAMFE